MIMYNLLALLNSNGRMVNNLVLYLDTITSVFYIIPMLFLGSTCPLKNALMILMMMKVADLLFLQ